MADQPLDNLDNPALKARFGYSARPTQYYGRTNTNPLVKSAIQHPNIQSVSYVKPKVIKKAKPIRTISATPSIKQSENTHSTSQDGFTAPVYLNNYNNEYEDTKYRRFSFHELRIKKRAIFSSTLIMALVLGGAYMAFSNYTNHKSLVHAQSTQGASYSLTGPPAPNTGNYASTSEPSQSQIASYSVAPTSPKYLSIPQLNVSSMITPVGLSGNYYLQAPSNIFNVGWWQNSSLPGQAGAVVLDGFANDSTSDGVFASLNKIKVGSTFQVQLGNNSVVKYQVLKVANIGGSNGVSMDEAISPINPGTPSLNMITCTGLTTSCPGPGNNDMVVFAQQQ